jgi:hypothetical protein
MSVSMVMVISLRYARWLALLGACAWIAGCASRPHLVPGPDAETVTPGGTIATASAADVTVTVDPDAWRGGVSIAHAVTPMHVRIENKSGEKLAIRYRHFAMLGDSGERFAALPPYEIRGTVAGVGPARRYPPINRLGFTHDGFYVAPFYHFMYPSVAVYHAHPFGFDPFYYDGYYPHWSRERAELPTPEMLRVALPEGVLEENGVLAGFLYFEPVEARASPVTFRADIVDIVSGEAMGSVTIPFVMQTAAED